MPRRVKVQYKPVDKTGSLSALAGKLHFHQCVEHGCNYSYNCYCDAPAINGQCRHCRGLDRPFWETQRDPKPCCFEVELEVVADAKWRVRQLLGGPGPWFRCPTCGRYHGWKVS